MAVRGVHKIIMAILGAMFAECDITFVPVFLGGIIRETGNTPPIQITNKAEWVDKERRRWAKLFNVPMADAIPPGFPAMTVKVQRALTAVTILHPEKLVDTVAAIYHASFVEHKEVHTPESLMPLLQKIYGAEGTRDILTKSTTDQVKKLLTAKTDEAIAEGSFGLPWYAATNAQGEKECFWGFDHIAQVADHLGLERPKSGRASERGWRAML